MRIILRYLTILGLILAILARQGYAKSYGNTAAQFLDIGVGARAVGMGGAYTALSDEANAVYWNPAGLNYLKKNEISSTYIRWLDSINYGYIAFAGPTKFGAFGAGVSCVLVPEMQKYDNTGKKLDETFNPFDLALTVSLGRKFGGIFSGASLKFIYSDIEDESATGLAFDLGAIYEVLPNKISLGMVIQNLGTRMKFREESAPLPLTLKFGSTFRLNEEIILCFDLNEHVYGNFEINSGLEYSHGFSKNLSCAGRVGFRTNAEGSISYSTANLFAGMGVDFRKYSLDYAWVPYGDLGNSHRISFVVRF